MIDCVPVFPRGTGFGNRLFNWARAEVYARRHGLRVVAPVWASARWRPLVLGGVDPAAYVHQVMLLDVLRRPPDEAGPLRLARLRLFGRAVPEPLDLDAPPPRGGAGDYLRFSGAGGPFHSFAPLAGEDGFLAGRLAAITRPRWAGVARRLGPYARGAIGINVRRGKDFKDAKSKQDFFTTGALRTPLDWFADVLRLVRRVAGRDVPALLVSDGSEADLAPLLACGNVRFARPGSAASDLLLLSQTRALIGSGGSSFTAWASFLGRMPTVVHPGQCLSWYGLPTRPAGHAATLDSDAPDPGVVADLAAALAEAPRGR